MNVGYNCANANGRYEEHSQTIDWDSMELTLGNGSIDRGNGDADNLNLSESLDVSLNELAGTDLFQNLCDLPDLRDINVLPHDLFGNGNLNNDQIYQAIPGPSNALNINDLQLQLQQQVDTLDLDKIIFPDKESIVTEDWKGSYNFNVTPTPEPNEKKSIFNIELNKLFANKDVTVPFRIEMDYGKIIDGLTIRTNLVFMDNDVKEVPVERCLKHSDKEGKVTDPDKKYRLPHILRPSTPGDVRYFQNDVTKRCYLTMPVKNPEPGVDYTTRSFNFACLNSCISIPSSGTSTIKRDLGMLFVLYDKRGNQFGRKFIKLRVCSAPARDHAKEIGKQSGQNRKRRSTDGDRDQTPLGEPKRAAHDIDGEVIGLPAQPSVRCVIAGTLPTSEESVSSSQESVYSSTETDTRIPFRKLVKEIQWCLKQKNSKSPALRDYSRHVFGQLRVLQDLTQSARKLELPIVKEESEKSPDAGFDDEEHGPD